MKLAVLRALIRILWDGASGDVPAAPLPTQSDLQRRVAEALMAREVERWGWAADIGILGPDALLDEAAQVLSAIALGTAESGPPIP